MRKQNLKQIGQKDILWNYGATFLKIASSALLLPFILKMMPPGMVGIWSVFMTITTFTVLLDFGFGPSFTRNISYIFSGVKNLKINGHERVEKDDYQVDYSLLKGVINAMRWFYLRMAIVLFILLATAGTLYIKILLKEYQGDSGEVLITWLILCIINTYNLYTFYYDSLLQGSGLIKRSKQIVVTGQLIYVVIASILVMKGKGLIGIASSQAISVIVIRFLSYYSFFTKEIRTHLKAAITRPVREIINAVYPNAVKVGLTSLGGFLVQWSAIIIGSLYLPLGEIASYGITMQLITAISGISGIYISTYQPQIAQLRVMNNTGDIKKLYLENQRILILTFLICGAGLLVLGDRVLEFIDSQTELLSFPLIFLALITSLIEKNLSIAGSIILTKNIVPFFKSSLISGGAIVIGLLLCLNFTNGGLLVLIVVPLVVDIAYQAWKWPVEVRKDLGIPINIFSRSKNVSID
jgi:O-antigen/teichoic acid export membrane protein